MGMDTPLPSVMISTRNRSEQVYLRDLIAVLREHPTLAAEFAPGALDAWTAEFEAGPKSSRMSMSLVVALILALGVVIGAVSAYRPAHAETLHAERAQTHAASAPDQGQPTPSRFNSSRLRSTPQR